MSTLKSIWKKWRYMGFEYKQLKSFEGALALENMRMLYSYCTILFPLIIVVLLLHIILNGERPSSFWFIVLIDILILIIGLISRSLCKIQKEKALIYAKLFTTLFISGLYLMGIFYDVIIHSSEVNVILCIIFFAAQMMFDSYPLDNFIMTMIVAFVTLITERRFAAPELYIGNSLNIILPIVGGMYMSWYKSKGKFALLINGDLELKLQEKNAQIKMMSSQIRPHFIYNVLTTISTLIKKNPEVAYDASIAFADYLRGNLDSLNDLKPIPFLEELKHLDTYYTLEKIRFEERIGITYYIETEDFLVPALTVEPLVENAIKHGVHRKEGRVNIFVSSREYEDHVEITVEDDGPGFVVGEEKKDGREHLGVENVHRRLALLSQGTLEIESAVGVGTKACIRIPKERENA